MSPTIPAVKADGEMEQSVANEVDVAVEAVSITVAAGSVILTVYIPSAKAARDPYPPPYIAQTFNPSL
jgi:hypothetical protein